jgi:hypothetical protein
MKQYGNTHDKQANMATNKVGHKQGQREATTKSDSDDDPDTK